MFPNEYLGAHEFLGRDVTKTIKSVAIEELRVTGGKKERRPVITFSDAKKRFVLNKTNAKSIAKLHGNDTKDWTGKQITMYPTRCMLKKEEVDCIRIREKSGHAAESVPVDEHPYEIDEGTTVDEHGEALPIPEADPAQ